MTQKTIEIHEDIYAEQNRIANGINENLSKRGIFSIDILGGAGAGKTSSLIRIIEALKTEKVSVIEGDIESDIDTVKLQKLGIEAYQINTGGNCHLDSPMIEAILPKLRLFDDGWLFMENIGNLVCPADFIIGEHLKMLICSVPEGSDKPYKYPLAFQKAGLILLNKADLKPYIDFDGDFFYKGVRALTDAPVFEVCAKTGVGFAAVAEFLQERKRELVG